MRIISNEGKNERTGCEEVIILEVVDVSEDEEMVLELDLEVAGPNIEVASPNITEDRMPERMPGSEPAVAVGVLSFAGGVGGVLGVLGVCGSKKIKRDHKNSFFLEEGRHVPTPLPR